MANPWLAIPANDYDRHMSHPSVRQRNLLDRVFEDVLRQRQPRNVAVLGCATGGGLDRIDAQKTEHVTAIDINSAYARITRERFAERLPQLEVLHADLHSLELDTNTYDLIYCGLVLEYVEPVVVLNKISRWLSHEGMLAVVLQLHSSDLAPVTESGVPSLKHLATSMHLIDPEAFRQQAAAASLMESSSSIEKLDSGKRFYVGKLIHGAQTDR